MDVFNKDWEEWIDHNISLGNCKNIMFQKSLDAGYSYDLIKQKLNIDYVVSSVLPEELTNKCALKNAIKVNNENLEIYKIENFLNNEECKKLIEIINSSNLINSQTINANEYNAVNSLRTSKTCNFENNDLINEIDMRICKTIGINNRFAEKIQAQKYEIGQEFKIHTDYFDETILLNNDSIKSQRTWTFMIYLNDMPDESSGGHTSFPYAYLSFQPKMGTAITWNNLNKGFSNTFSHHKGMPILKGEKYIITKWFREKETDFSIPNQVSENNFLPIFHNIGFEKKKIKLECVDKIKEWMNNNTNKFIKEQFSINSEIEKNINSNILSFNTAPSELQELLKNEISLLLTEWINYKTNLNYVCTYGIREYLKGSILKNHYDKKESHVISAIIHLDDKSEKPWPLYIEDHHFRPNEIEMEYGDVVFYESSTCLHGRPTPFDGYYYRNMYIHFKPEKWEEYIR
jgi:prolyl 4-hydroxylase